MKRKMTDEEKTLSKKKKQDKLNEDNLLSSLKDLRRRKFYGNPTIFYNVGDRVIRGAIKRVTVTEILDDGRIYKVHEICTNNNYGKPYDYERDSYVSWVDIEPYVSPEEDSKIIAFKKEDDIRLNIQTRGVGALISFYWNWGVDTETDYQRGNVWTSEQEHMLIDSIFNNVQIGTFVFVYKKYQEGEKGYEIIDGKQRLLTLVRFAESRFSFNGRLYRDLCSSDRRHFDDYYVGYSEVRDITQSQKYELFIRLNTCGKIQDQAHIEKVRRMLESSK